MSDKNQWSTVKPLTTAGAVGGWIPPEDRDRIAAYLKYDEMYWNDQSQYALRVLEGEQPLYIPNARTVVDTTAFFLMKGLKLTVENGDQKTKDALEAFVKRETFYSKYQNAKHSGVVRGDYVFHLTANPKKLPGKRLSITSVEPMNVFPIWDEDEPDRMIGCHLATTYTKDDAPDKIMVRRLTYRIVDPLVAEEQRRISREEAIFEIDPSWWGPKAKKVQTVLAPALLDPAITSIPVYWFKNRGYQGEDYGSSELRGLEVIAQTISQGSTDVSAALALEGLGVYATDGGRPVDEDGNEAEWEVAPGRVMEVPAGSYFRRVEGVGSITPAVDQINYLENKMHEAVGLSDVALGKVDAQTAQSGIALAIKFMPTLAKIETRDEDGVDKLGQLFYDWKTWHEVFEHEQLSGDIVPVIGDKLPTDRVAKLNELNNMLDRNVISMKYYREQMQELGYKFPDDMEQQIKDEAAEKIEAARATFLATREPSDGDDETSDDEGGTPSTEGNTLPTAGNRSNNRNAPNESKGTEAK